jgi:UDP-N-acetyl-D-glucosamine dehydrogenase
MSSRLEDLENRIRNRQAEIAVVGQGYVGLPLALELARAGFSVTGIDVNPRKVEELNAGQSYIEDITSEEIQAQIDAGRFRATTQYSDISRVDCINICVPTPLRRTKDPDVSFIVAAVEEVRKRIRSGQLVVLGSTTYPGTTHELYRPMIEECGLRVGHDIALAFAPERIDPANRNFAFRSVPKVVGGETELCTRLATRMFEAIFDHVIRVSSSQAAEMVKLLENTFRMINIGLANEVAMMCDRLELDVWEVIDAAATKPYGFMRFEPGPGLGGHCIPVDPSYLAWKLRSLNFNARFIEVASDVNGSMPKWVVERIGRLLNAERKAINGSRILLLGVAYKAEVSDTRESPAVDIFLELHHLGAEVSFHDPWVAEVEIAGRTSKSVDLTNEELEAADLVVVLTGHKGVDYERVCQHAPIVFDTRNACRNVGERPNVVRL